MLTVVTPVLNAERYLSNCIASVAALAVPHEHIIVDGGSTDGSLAIAKSASGVHVRQQGDAAGMYGAIEEGLRAGSGEYLTYVNADDLAVAEVYARLYERMGAPDAPTLAYADAIYRWAGNGEPPRDHFVPARPFAAYFLRVGILPFTQPSCIFRRDAHEAVGGFDHRVYRISGDLDFFRRLATLPGFQAVRLRGIASIFLKHGTSLGDLNSEVSEAERERMGVDRRAALGHRILFRLASWV